jgi:hypothetical protein
LFQPLSGEIIASMMHLKVLWKCKFLIPLSGMDDQDKISNSRGRWFIVCEAYKELIGA